MAHDQAAVGKAGQKARKKLVKSGLGRERIRSRESRIGCDAQPCRFAAETDAQNVERESLVIVHSPAWSRTAALSYPGAGHFLCHDSEKGVPYLRKQMDVLMTIQEIGRTSKCVDKSL